MRDGFRRGVRRWGGAALMLITFAFLARLVLEDLDALRAVRWTLSPGWLVAAVGGQALCIATNMALWGLAVRGTDAPPVGWRALWRVWSVASFARYVPGGVWQFVATDALAPRVGLERRTWAQTLAVHSGFQLISAALVGLALGPFARPWLALPCVALVHPALVRLALGAFARLVGQAPLTWRLTFSQSVGLLAPGVASWLGSGVSWWWLLRGLDVAVPWTWAAGVHALGFVAGFVVLLAPAGLGVRELALTAALGPLVGPGRAVLLAAASRAWGLAAELLSAALAQAPRR